MRSAAGRAPGSAICCCTWCSLRVAGSVGCEHSFVGVATQKLTLCGVFSTGVGAVGFRGVIVGCIFVRLLVRFKFGGTMSCCVCCAVYRSASGSRRESFAKGTGRARRVLPKLRPVDNTQRPSFVESNYDLGAARRPVVGEGRKYDHEADSRVDERAPFFLCTGKRPLFWTIERFEDVFEILFFKSELVEGGAKGYGSCLVNSIFRSAGLLGGNGCAEAKIAFCLRQKSSPAGRAVGRPLHRACCRLGVQHVGD
jgi:hypothetical protein